uniref:Epidermal patterning factor-like protein n=1 Tax=Oryza barthii TaxID=65489 RepID=A0A0D3HSL3_9ORYZ
MAPRAAALVLAAVLMITMIACGAARKKDAVSMPRRLHAVTTPPSQNRRALQVRPSPVVEPSGCCSGHRSEAVASWCPNPTPCDDP